LAVKVRLTRVGSKKNPIWRVVVADGRSPRDGRSIETIGHYNPQTQPSRIEIDRERLQHWLDRGAQPSNTVKKLMRAANTGYEMPASAAPAPPVTPPAEPEAPAAEEAAAAEEAPAEQESADAPKAEAPADAEAAVEEAAAEQEASEQPAPEPAADAEADADAAAEADAPVKGDSGDDDA
jgi:small subunit ribosomal protein S16